jgi:pyruvate/2-oxoglutarate dehydrogenase complex dihydrolipoamide acyltransferase (E2) component
MPTDIKIPAMGESVTEGTLIKWHKQDGEFINADEPIAELETDKANTDVPAPASGVVKRTVKEGTVVKVGQAIGTIDTDAKVGAAPKHEADVYHALKHKRRIRPDQLSESERLRVEKRGVMIRIHRFVTAPYFWVRRPVMRWLNRTGRVADAGSN